jgi:hypothetical protein
MGSFFINYDKEATMNATNELVAIGETVQIYFERDAPGRCCSTTTAVHADAFVTGYYQGTYTR